MHTQRLVTIQPIYLDLHSEQELTIVPPDRVQVSWSMFLLHELSIQQNEEDFSDSILKTPYSFLKI